MINPNLLGRKPFPADASQWMLVGLRGGGAVAPIDPSTITGLKLWLKADALALSDGAAVTTWTDSSGLGNNFTTFGAAPIYKTGIVNAQPIVRFNGSTQGLHSAAVSLISANYTIFVVASAASTSAASHCIFATGQSVAGGTAVLIRRDVDTLRHYHFDSGFVWTTELLGIVAGAWNVITGDWNGSNIHLWRNGTLKDTTGSTLIGRTGTQNSIGADEPDATGDYWDGDIAEVLIYNSALSTTDRQAVENYLKTKYATP